MNNPGAFWSWFEKNEHRFRDLEVPEMEQLLDEIHGRLRQFCDELWFELGGAPGGPHELIISAEGQARLFPEVRRLVGAAPVIPGWAIIAFKPAHGFEFVTQYKGLTLAPQKSWFLPLESRTNPERLGLRVAYADFDPTRERAFLSATYIMLEAGLGEVALAEDVHHVEVALLPSDPESQGYIELHELAEYIAFWKRRAKSRSGVSPTDSGPS